MAGRKFSEKKLVEEILREARVLNLHMGAAEVFATKTTAKVKKWAEKRAAFTQDDLDRVTALELEKYNKDLAYVYKNRNKII